MQNISQRYRISLNVTFSLDCVELSSLVPILESENIVNIFLTGPDQNGISGKARDYGEDFNNYKGFIYEDRKDELTCLWRKPNDAFLAVIDALKKRKHPLSIYISGQSLSPETHDELEASIPQCVEFIDETHELNLELLDYSLYSYWLSSETKRMVDEDPDVFIKEALQMLGGTDTKQDSHHDLVDSFDKLSLH